MPPHPPLKKYRTVMADPPWPYNSQDLKAAPLHRPNTWDSVSGGVSSERRYGVMSVNDIKSLPLSLSTDTDCHLYLWTTNSFMIEAHEVAAAWGFKVKTIITWCKHKQGSDEPSMKMGYWFRSATEHCLFAVKGTLRLRDKATVPTWFYHPRLEHSEKPDSFKSMVETVSEGPYLELFSRKLRSSWDVWGNQVSSVYLRGFPRYDVSVIGVK